MKFDSYLPLSLSHDRAADLSSFPERQLATWRAGQRGSGFPMSDASDRISELFAVGSRDLTPASARHAAHVLYAPVWRDAEVSRRRSAPPIADAGAGGSRRTRRRSVGCGEVRRRWAPLPELLMPRRVVRSRSTSVVNSKVLV